jgi:uncharacterized protein (TIGR00369 family)
MHAETPDWEKLRGGRSSLLGYRMVEMGGGRSHVSWSPQDNVGNPMGFVHGGFVGVLIDDVAGMALSSLLTDWRAFPTASLHVDFLRGIKVGDTVTCRGAVVRAGRRLTVADTSIRDADDQLLARGTCMFAVDLSDTDLVGFTSLADGPGS